MEGEEFQLDFPFNRSRISPKEMNIGKVEQALRRYQEIDEETRASIMEGILDLPNIEYLNAKILAGALVLLHRTNYELIPGFLIVNYKDIYRTLEVAPEHTEENERYQEALIRYMSLIVDFRSNRDKDLYAI
jgi:Lhr-like helicase